MQLTDPQRPIQQLYQRLSHSLRWRLLTLLGAILLSTLLITAASVLSFTYRNEQRAWQGPQSEAARHASQTVSEFIRRTQDALVLAGLHERDES